MIERTISLCNVESRSYRVFTEGSWQVGCKKLSFTAQFMATPLECSWEAIHSTIPNQSYILLKSLTSINSAFSCTMWLRGPECPIAIKHFSCFQNTKRKQILKTNINKETYNSICLKLLEDSALSKIERRY